MLYHYALPPGKSMKVQFLMLQLAYKSPQPMEKDTIIHGTSSLNDKHRLGVTSDNEKKIVLDPSVSSNSLRPSNAIWRHRTRPILAQGMACCLTAPSHYLNQCWLLYSNLPGVNELTQTSQTSMEFDVWIRDKIYIKLREVMNHSRANVNCNWAKVP